MKCPDKNRAFTLIELLVVMFILLSISGLTYTLGWPVLKQLTDPRSDLVVSYEVDDAADWLRSAITRSLWTGSDFVLTVSNKNAENWLRIRWNTSDTSRATEEWSSERIAFKSLSSGKGEHFYSSKFQTLSPALSIKVYHGDDRQDHTDWLISISGYGFLRAYRQS